MKTVQATIGHINFALSTENLISSFKVLDLGILMKVSDIWKLNATHNYTDNTNALYFNFILMFSWMYHYSALVVDWYRGTPSTPKPGPN